MTLPIAFALALVGTTAIMLLPLCLPPPPDPTRRRSG